MTTHESPKIEDKTETSADTISEDIISDKERHSRTYK